MVPLRRIEALAENPDLARASARHLAIEVQRARVQSPRTVAERVDAWITLHDNALPPKGNWQQLASEIGVTPEPLYRELARRH
jgi:CRP-like cAMP-binding protein